MSVIKCRITLAPRFLRLHLWFKRQGSKEILWGTILDFRPFSNLIPKSHSEIVFWGNITGMYDY